MDQGFAYSERLDGHALQDSTPCAVCTLNDGSLIGQVLLGLRVNNNDLHSEAKENSAWTVNGRRRDSPSLHDRDPRLRMSTLIPAPTCTPIVAPEPLAATLRKFVHLQLGVPGLLRVVYVTERKGMFC